MNSFDIRTLNNNYAPGIATYGIDGNTGEKGNSGTSVYFTSYNLEYGSSTENEQTKVLVKINQNKILSDYVDQTTPRPYVVGDIIIDSNGFVYSLYKKNGAFALQYISKLNNDDSSTCFSKVNNRVMLNYNGFDIINSTEDNTIVEETTYPMRVASYSKDLASGNYNLLSLLSQSYVSEQQKSLNVFYNKEDDSFHFETNSRIVFDTSSLMVKGTDSQISSFDDYYKIEPYKDPVGLLHRVYSNATFRINADELRVEGFKNDYPTIDIVPDYLKIKELDSNHNIVNEIMIEVDQTAVSSLDTYFIVKVDSTLASKVDKLRVSLVKGVEIYIKKK